MGIDSNPYLHGNMVHDNFSDETMPPSFRNTTNGDYTTQDYENNPSLFNPNIDNIQQDKNLSIYSESKDIAY
ncbi:hypothetical protein RhiirB3_453826 [Rhizophagus irregularis]|nr:hypothetical protein RhiirB3_453826 [Rhizophagus irregularis]